MQLDFLSAWLIYRINWILSAPSRLSYDLVPLQPHHVHTCENPKPSANISGVSWKLTFLSRPCLLIIWVWIRTFYSLRQGEAQLLQKFHRKPTNLFVRLVVDFPLDMGVSCSTLCPSALSLSLILLSPHFVSACLRSFISLFHFVEYISIFQP